MTSSDAVRGMIAFIGLLTQLSGAFLLATLFFLLRGHARRRAYFRVWGMAWLAMLAALWAVTLLYTDPSLAVGSGPRARLLLFGYQVSKLVHVMLLGAGALAYARGIRARRVVPSGIMAAAVYAALSVTFSTDLNGVVAWQAPVSAVVLAGSAWLLLALPPLRASLGSRATGVFFGMLASLWVAYTVAFGAYEAEGPVVWRAFLLVMQHNSYIDLLLQMLLGYGMVMLLMEDLKRETDAAHAQLAVAHDELKRLALYDTLTGALNRRAFAEGVGIQQVRGAWGAAVMMDMDGFKAVNDTWGHAAGDEVLRRLADTLRAAIRPTDRLYRWGGDEFLLLLPGAAADEVVPRLEEVLARANEGHPPGDPLRLEASLGGADHAGAEELEDAIRRADAAMYARKAARRRVVRVPVEPSPRSAPPSA